MGTFQSHAWKHVYTNPPKSYNIDITYNSATHIDICSETLDEIQVYKHIKSSNQ